MRPSPPRARRTGAAFPRARPAPSCRAAGRRCRRGERSRPRRVAGSTAGRAAGSPGRATAGRGGATGRGSRLPARRSGRGCSAFARSYFTPAAAYHRPGPRPPCARDPPEVMMRPPFRDTLPAPLALLLTLTAVLALAAAPPRSADLDFESRARDLVSRMTAEEKISQLTNRARGHPAPRRAGVRLVERVPARRRPRRRRHRVPAGHRPGRDLRHAPRCSEMADGDRRRGPGQAPPVRPPGQARAVPGPHLLVAEHQHLPRPALGPRPGDLRRGPLPHRADGRRVREGPAGRRPAIPAR